MVRADVGEIDHRVNKADAEGCALAADQRRHVGGVVFDIDQDMKSAGGGVVLRQVLQRQEFIRSSIQWRC